MKLTAKQAFVFEHLHDVVRTKRLVSPKPRYTLYGIECDAQIRSLVIKDYVAKTETGDLRLTSKKPLQPND